MSASSLLPAVHQLLSGYTRGDAISNEARALRQALRERRGVRSEIYCLPDRVLPDLAGDFRDANRAVSEVQPGDVVLLHLSMGSPVNALFAALPCRKIVLYHNVTPAAFFAPINRRMTRSLTEGREALRELVGVADINLAVSRFNARELEALGYPEVGVLRPLLGLDRFDGSRDPGVMERYDDGLVNVLFVGRCAPNKRIEDLLHAFYYFQRYVEPQSRLIHVGSFDGTERYLSVLQLAKLQLGLENVDFVGAVPEAHLRAYYASADLFLCMSAHEGFCIPLLEAMHAGLPVLARAAGAIPETLDGAGMLLEDCDYPLIAELMGRSVRDAPFRASILEGQEARLERYRQEDPAAKLFALLDHLDA